MAWAFVSSVSFAEGEDGIYKFLVLPMTPAAVAWGLAVDAVVSGALPRRRTGFMLPFVGVDNRQLLGPTVETISGLSGEDVAFHLIDYSYLSAYTGLAQRVSGFGVGFAPDRGVFPCNAVLFRLT